MVYFRESGGEIVGFIIGAVVVFGLLYILGVDITTLLSILQILMTVLTCLCALFFVFCDILLLFASKKQPARLLEIEKDSAPETEENGEDEKTKMLSRFAFYEVQGERLRNWFPAESVMRKRIYSKRECHVRIAKLGHKRLVFDRHSMVIVAAGTVLMGLGVVGMTLHWLFVLKVL